jgi:hypothetical protein
VLDIIGDVHGQFDKLVALLTHLGYNETGSTWRHPSRSVIFVGDLIDRGPKQLATVDLVRRMVETGTAQCVMGNHEFNAIAWATADPEHPGEFLRPHGKTGNKEQHRAFLDEVQDTPRHAEVIAWFKTLPLWLDLGGIRVVHACWHQATMDRLRPLMGPDDTLTDELILLGSRKEHWRTRRSRRFVRARRSSFQTGFHSKTRKGRFAQRSGSGGGRRICRHTVRQRLDLLRTCR